jgi:CDP-diacylglycerol--serine O-phosphatidyltransferase
MSRFSKISLGDLFTLANGVLGFLAITYIYNRSFLAATSLLLLSMLMDGLDGQMARRFGSKHTMGQVLDSISDAISFAFAPGILVYAELHDAASASPTFSVNNAVAITCAAAILATGLFRLARFSSGGFQLDHFTGLPAPGAALVMILVCLLFGASSGSEDQRYYFTISTEPVLVIVSGLLISYLMSSEIRYPKLRGWMAGVSAIGILLALVPTIAGLALVSDQDLYTAFSRTATGLALVLTLAYVFGGPAYEKLARGKGG